VGLQGSLINYAQIDAKGFTIGLRGRCRFPGRGLSLPESSVLRLPSKAAMLSVSCLVACTEIAVVLEGDGGCRSGLKLLMGDGERDEGI
jgi:hypothetical protein